MSSELWYVEVPGVAVDARDHEGRQGAVGPAVHRCQGLGEGDRGGRADPYRKVGVVWDPPPLPDTLNDFFLKFTARSTKKSFSVLKNKMFQDRPPPPTPAKKWPSRRP